MAAAEERRRAWRFLMRRARRQHGVFTWAQAEEAGVTRGQLRGHLGRGTVERWRWGVFAVGGMPDSWERRAMAALLAGGPRCVLSHWSAAYLHGLLFVSRPTEFHLLFPRGRRRKLDGVGSHTTQVDDEVEGCLVGQFLVTSVERTICDLARAVSEGVLERLVADAWRRGLTSPDEVLLERERLVAAGRRRGMGNLRRVLARMDPRVARTRTDYESAAFLALRGSDLPLPETDVPVTTSDGRTFFLDLAYVEVKLAIELDSDTYHGISYDRRRDAERQRLLEADGWVFLRVSNVEIRDDPDGFVRRIRGLLRELGMAGV